jgi:hypothetical protein
MTDNRDALNLRPPPAGSARASERGELASFNMRFDKTREASGINAGMTRVPEAPEAVTESFADDGKGDPGPRFGKIPHQRF